MRNWHFAIPDRVVSVPENGPMDLFSEQPAAAGSARSPRSERGQWSIKPSGF